MTIFSFPFTHLHKLKKNTLFIGMMRSDLTNWETILIKCDETDKSDIKSYQTTGELSCYNIKLITGLSFYQVVAASLLLGRNQDV